MLARSEAKNNRRYMILDFPLDNVVFTRIPMIGCSRDDRISYIATAAELLTQAWMWHCQFVVTTYNSGIH